MIFLFSGCSSTKLNHAWNKTKGASYIAVTDPLTWGSAVSAGVLYVTYDDDIRKHFMEHNLVDSEVDEPLREINGIVLYSSALFVDEDNSQEMMHRLATDFAGSGTARSVTNALNRNIKKETSSENHDFAIGSHHALDTFANSALTRKNVNDMSIPIWFKQY